MMNELLSVAVQSVSLSSLTGSGGVQASSGQQKTSEFEELLHQKSRDLPEETTQREGTSGIKPDRETSDRARIAPQGEDDPSADAAALAGLYAFFGAGWRPESMTPNQMSEVSGGADSAMLMPYETGLWRDPLMHLNQNLRSGEMEQTATTDDLLAGERTLGRDAMGRFRLEALDVNELTALQMGRPLFDVENVTMYKVAEPEPLDPNEWEFPVKLSTEIATAFEAGEESIEIELYPQSLGMLKIFLSKDQNGNLNVLMQVSSAKAYSLIEKHTPNMEYVLGLKTDVTAKVELQLREGAQQAQNQLFDHDGRNGGGYSQNQEQSEQQDETQNFIDQIRLGMLTPESAAV